MMKKILNMALVLFFVLSVTVNAQETKAEKKNPSGDAVVKVLYFHGNFRCMSCLTIERNTSEAVLGLNGTNKKGEAVVIEKSPFSGLIEKKQVEFKAVNAQDKKNLALVKALGVDSKSVVVALYKKGVLKEFKKLNKVWDYVRDTPKFKEYVRSEVKIYTDKLNQKKTADEKETNDIPTKTDSGNSNKVKK